MNTQLKPLDTTNQLFLPHKVQSMETLQSVLLQDIPEIVFQEITICNLIRNISHCRTLESFSMNEKKKIEKNVKPVRVIVAICFNAFHNLQQTSIPPEIIRKPLVF